MQLKNANFVFLGDSITQGASACCQENSYHQIIKQEYGLKAAANCGIGGTRIAKRNTPSGHISDLYFALRVELLPTDADVVVVFGGTNDYGHGDSLLGDKESTDVYTFNGALNTLLSRLEARFPNSKFVFMTPLKRVNYDKPNCNGYVLKDYADAIIDFTQRNKLALIDLFNCDIFDPYDTDYFADGLHPNDKGHKLLADYVAKKLLEI